MSYRIEPTDSVENGFRRVAREQIESALDELADEDLDCHEKVHQVRKRCKKVRALARLVRPAFDDYSKINAAFRDTARRLSDLRDAKVRVDTFDELTDVYGEGLEDAALEPIRAALVAQREDVLGRHEERLEAVRSELVALREATGEWKLEADGFDAVADGFAKTYRRTRRTMKAAFDEPSTERFHEWRKRVKYHRYQVRLLADLWPGVFDTWRESLHDLTDLLGEGNDLTELMRADEALDAAGHEAGELIVALAEHRRQVLWDEAEELGERLFQDSKDVLLHRLESVWQAAAA